MRRTIFITIWSVFSVFLMNVFGQVLPQWNKLNLESTEDTLTLKINKLTNNSLKFILNNEKGFSWFIHF